MGRIKNVEDFNRIVISYLKTARSITLPTSAGAGHVQESQRDAIERHAAVASCHASSPAPTPSKWSIASGACRKSRTPAPDLEISIGNDQSRFIRDRSRHRCT
jgi:hypothetical protein